jgi:hypothetical protein
MKFYYSGVLVKNKTNPFHPSRVENLSNAKDKKRVYKWNASNKRLVRSRASYLAFQGKINYFVTLTMVTEIDDNKVVKLFIDNLKKRGYINSYIWVKERGSKGNRLHYHLLFNTDCNLFGSNKKISKVDYMANIEIFQTAWNSAQIRLGGSGSHNSFRLGRSPYIKSVERVGFYITKYITKELGEFDSRMYACSNDLKDVEILANNDKENTISYKPYRIVENDYTTNEYYSLNLGLIKEVEELGKLHTALSVSFLDHTGSEAPVD